MGFEERLPARRSISRRSRFDAICSEDVPDGSVGDLVAEVDQHSLDPIVAPGRVLPGHAQDKPSNFVGNRLR